MTQTVRIEFDAKMRVTVIECDPEFLPKALELVSLWESQRRPAYHWKSNDTQTNKGGHAIYQRDGIDFMPLAHSDGWNVVHANNFLFRWQYGGVSSEVSRDGGKTWQKANERP